MENGNTVAHVAPTNSLARASSALNFNGTSIRVDGEMVCLTDMWRASGSAESKRPNDWRQLPSAKDFIYFLSGTSADQSGSEWFRVVRSGPEVATFAHWQLALAYAKYLSPAFHAWCNTVVKAYMSGEPKAPSLQQRAIQAERRLALQERKLELEERKFGSTALSNVAARLRDAGRTDVALALDVKAAEFATGEFLHLAMPEAPHHDWLSPTAIAQKFNTSAHAVGRACTKLGIRGEIDGICRPIVNVAPGTNREVTSYIYSPAAVEQIKAHLEGGAQ